jgi:hypothetical protein
MAADATIMQPYNMKSHKLQNKMGESDLCMRIGGATIHIGRRHNHICGSLATMPVSLVTINSYPLSVRLIGMVLSQKKCQIFLQMTMRIAGKCG